MKCWLPVWHCDCSVVGAKNLSFSPPNVLLRSVITFSPDVTTKHSFSFHNNGSNLHQRRFLNLHDASGFSSRKATSWFTKDFWQMSARFLPQTKLLLCPSWIPTVAWEVHPWTVSWTPQAFSLQRLSSGSDEIYLTCTHQQSITTY